MQDILFKVFRWLLGVTQIKFVLFTALFAIMNFFSTAITDLLGSVVSTTGLSSAFSSLPSSVWYFINLLNLSYGVPIIIGAYVTRFLIRRIPFFG